MAAIPLNKLKTYQLSREYGQECWEIYEHLTWEIIKVMGAK